MKARTIRDVAALARDRRKRLGWSQSRLAEAAGVGREWIIEFEKAKPTVEWGLVLRALKELGLTLDLLEGDPASHPQGDSDLDRILKRRGNRP